MIRPFLAVFLSIVLWGVLWVATSFIFMLAVPDAFDESGMTTSTGILAAFLGISMFLSLLAGFTCARIARQSHMRVVTILAVIQFLIGLGVQLGAWDTLPLWYHIPFLALVIPLHLVGGKIGHKTKET